MPQGVGAISAGFGAFPQIRDAAGAAKAFESMLLKQLLSTMTRSTKESGLFGGGFEADLYSDMFADAVAQQASGAGLGMSEMIQKALGVEERTAKSTTVAIGNALRGLSEYRATVTGTTESPANVYLAGLAESWLSGEAASRWSTNGELSVKDLAAELTTDGKGGTAVFNVADANGYKGYPKCNLFAFEMVRRAGFTVPVRAREHGWSYPGADTVAKMAEEGATGQWAKVRTRESVESLDVLATSGTPLILASAADGDSVGHMAVADRIHDIKRDAQGNIASIEYSGWDAANSGSRYARRIWRLASIQGQGRGGLSQIQILEPVYTEGVDYVPVDGNTPGASISDSKYKRSGAQYNAVTTDIQYEDVKSFLNEVSEATK